MTMPDNHYLKLGDVVDKAWHCGLELKKKK
jgi:hypothetical protein